MTEEIDMTNLILNKVVSDNEKWKRLAEKELEKLK